MQKNLENNITFILGNKIVEASWPFLNCILLHTLPTKGTAILNLAFVLPTHMFSHHYSIHMYS